jgi:hypothetical protein
MALRRSRVRLKVRQGVRAGIFVRLRAFPGTQRRFDGLCQNSIAAKIIASDYHVSSLQAPGDCRVEIDLGPVFNGTGWT